MSKNAPTRVGIYKYLTFRQRDRESICTYGYAVTTKQARTPSSQLQKRKGAKPRDVGRVWFFHGAKSHSGLLKPPNCAGRKGKRGGSPSTGQTCLCTGDGGGGGRGGAVPSSSSSCRRDPPLRPPPGRPRPVLLPAPSSPSSPCLFFYFQLTSPGPSPARRKRQTGAGGTRGGGSAESWARSRTRPGKEAPRPAAPLPSRPAVGGEGLPGHFLEARSSAAG